MWHTDQRLSVCGRCHIERYCGRDCQKAAWPKHKQVCVQSAKKESLVKTISTDPSKTTIKHTESTSIVDAHLLLSKEKPVPIVKSKEKMTAKEYTSTVTAADARLPTSENSRFWIRNMIRKVCRFFPEEPYKHIYICFERWSTQIGYLVFVKDTASLEARVADDPTAMKFLSNKEFETTVNRLFPDFLINSWGSYSVDFSDSDMRRACERHNYPYRPKDLPEYCWDEEITYYVNDPDIE